MYIAVDSQESADHIVIYVVDADNISQADQMLVGYFQEHGVKTTGPISFKRVALPLAEPVLEAGKPLNKGLRNFYHFVPKVQGQYQLGQRVCAVSSDVGIEDEITGIRKTHTGTIEYCVLDEWYAGDSLSCV